MDEKCYLVYYVRDSMVFYLKSIEGENLTMSMYKQDAQLFTYNKAYKLATKFNRCLDHGVAKRYGWAHKDS